MHSLEEEHHQLACIFCIVKSSFSPFYSSTACEFYPGIQNFSVVHISDCNWFRRAMLFILESTLLHSLDTFMHIISVAFVVGR